MINTSEKIIYKELSYALNGIFYVIHDTLGKYAREKQYGDLFEKFLTEKEIVYKREALISKTGLDINKADFVIENKIIVEFKVKPFVMREDYHQVKRYLEFSDLLLGILVNFRQQYLKPKRIINNKYSKQ
ncbi:MAG: GxxExxY protein [bacterium]|nr:GxxExxY protein [bacterium]